MLDGDGTAGKMGIEEIQSNSGKHVLLKCKVTSAAFVLGDVTTWLSYSFAREWYSDALNEACKRNDHHARRREIVFAVSSSESYLLEWVRDAVLQRDFHKLETLFLIYSRMCEFFQCDYAYLEHDFAQYIEVNSI